jgi:hypothetical protein
VEAELRGVIDAAPRPAERGIVFEVDIHRRAEVYLLAR